MELSRAYLKFHVLSAKQDNEPNSTPLEYRAGPYNTSKTFCAPVVHWPENVIDSPGAAA
jgi:hypothetical protein